jgi:ABC-type transporter Mla maintaining outer membrane lipid asymmetry ATPase subunit MlaF
MIPGREGRFSYVFQDAALFDSMTVYDNIALPLLEGTSLAKADIRQRVQDKMQQFELLQPGPDSGRFAQRRHR